ncbi:hypothetical protein V1477_002170 [Vespula maculifrons]|uniref:Uncharacterized protein n=1 Tax=Vespula maculifrons TaxID=7453 RepID=A0ABD2CX75_VESMC
MLVVLRIILLFKLPFKRHCQMPIDEEFDFENNNKEDNKKSYIEDIKEPKIKEELEELIANYESVTAKINAFLLRNISKNQFHDILLFSFTFRFMKRSKTFLINESILKLYSIGVETELYTDAYSYTFAMIMQKELIDQLFRNQSIVETEKLQIQHQSMPILKSDNLSPIRIKPLELANDCRFNFRRAFTNVGLACCKIQRLESSALRCVISRVRARRSTQVLAWSRP